MTETSHAVPFLGSGRGRPHRPKKSTCMNPPKPTNHPPTVPANRNRGSCRLHNAGFATNSSRDDPAEAENPDSRALTQQQDTQIPPRFAMGKTEDKEPALNAPETEDGSQPSKTIKVAVGSKNPVKVNAVRQALHKAIGDSVGEMKIELDVQGFSVPSGVSDQPMGDEETRTGAKNRAEAAYQKYKETNGIFPNLGIGLEGGLEWSSTVKDEEDENTLWCMAWMAIYGKRTTLLADAIASPDSRFYSVDKKPILGFSKTGTFLLPSSLTKCIEEGMELGHADDKVFGRSNSKQKSGTVGVLTDGMIDRTYYYEHALILALVPWIRPDVYAPSRVEEQKNNKGRTGFSDLFCPARKS